VNSNEFTSRKIAWGRWIIAAAWGVGWSYLAFGASCKGITLI
jgi:hypothetical protein